MLDNEQRDYLSDVSRTLLTALNKIAELARLKLTESHPISPADVLADAPNPLRGGPSARLNLIAVHLKDEAYLKRLEIEPFVARIVVQWDDEEPPRKETLFITRASAAGIADEIPGIRLATYAATLGRLAEFKAGDRTTLDIRSRKRDVSIIERVTISPRYSNAEWDAIEDTFDFEFWSAELESVRRFLDQQERVEDEEGIPDVLGALLQAAQEATLVREAARRKVIERMTLRDQCILDRYQGEVFRMPLSQRLILFGPPGTGKTTTLIRRLAQKRTAEALTSDEVEMLSQANLKDEFLYSNSWAMFSPTELLKLYLRDAFNREGIPASDHNLKTWDKERLFLGKAVFRMLRSAEWSGFQLDETAKVLSDTSSASICHLYDVVSRHVESDFLDKLVQTSNLLQRSEDAEVRQLTKTIMSLRDGKTKFSVSEISGLLEEGSQLQPIIKRLNESIKQESHRLSNRLLHDHRDLLKDIVDALPVILQTELDEDEYDEMQSEPTVTHRQPRNKNETQGLALEILIATLQRLARNIAHRGSTVSGRAGRVAKVLGNRLPPQELLYRLGALITTRGNVRLLTQAPRLFVLGVPQSYRRFRRQNSQDESLFDRRSKDPIKQDRISLDEADVLLLIMLRNTRRLLEESPSQLSKLTSHDWLENIKGQYLTQVFVDEATDFSAAQLACTMELSDPRIRSWFACGDFNQRVTSNGIRNIEEINWLRQVTDKSIELREVNIPYRQSSRLQLLADALSEDNTPTSVKEPVFFEDADVWPLLAEGYAENRLASWLTDRIVEIESAVGKLPSIAIFVEEESFIEPLVAQIRPLLSLHNIPVVGCKDGRVVGDSLEVRVFDVRHIKGLEFEAVFFVGIDGLEESEPELFDRFFYVGVSRAATYLGVTCKNLLPSKLERVRHQFSTDCWDL